MELDVGYSLIPLVDARQNGELLDRIRSIRRQFAHDVGLVVPPLHIRDTTPATVEAGRVELEAALARCERRAHELLERRVQASCC